MDNHIGVGFYVARSTEQGEPHAMNQRDEQR